MVKECLCNKFSLTTCLTLFKISLLILTFTVARLVAMWPHFVLGVRLPVVKFSILPEDARF